MQYVFPAIIILMCTALTGACSQNAQISPVNTTPEGVAIKGYDPVAYFTEGKPVSGSPEFTFRWQNAEWRFMSAAHRDLFVSDPAKYSPQYGGYCAYAVSQGKTADIDPQAWTVLDDKLYLNLNKDVQGLWEKNMRNYILAAERNWPEILHKSSSR